MDETQLLEDAENSCVTGTLVLKEVNKNDDQEALLTNTTEILDTNKKPLLTTTNCGFEVASYCLKLVDPLKWNESDEFMLALRKGSNKIGRSNTSDICILDKNVSKSHARIEITEKGNGDLVDCFLVGTAALNKIRVNGEKVLGNGEKYALEVDDTILFGLTSFRLTKVNLFLF